MNLKLRKLVASDVNDVWVWASDDTVTKSLLWPSYQNKEDLLKYLKEVAERMEFCMAICLDSKVVGSITLERGKNVTNKHKAELGYVIAKEYWNKGIASRAVEMAVDLGFKDMGLKRIEALVDPSNLSSIRVLEKAGLNQEGLLKNYINHKNKICDRYIFASVSHE